MGIYETRVGDLEVTGLIRNYEACNINIMLLYYYIL